jgi:hypothetical protein
MTTAILNGRLVTVGRHSQGDTGCIVYVRSWTNGGIPRGERLRGIIVRDDHGVVIIRIGSGEDARYILGSECEFDFP